MHFYTDNKEFIFICVEDITDLIKYKKKILELIKKYHVFIYYKRGELLKERGRWARNRTKENFLGFYKRCKYC